VVVVLEVLRTMHLEDQEALLETQPQLIQVVEVEVELHQVELEELVDQEL
jgi:hypothetical protein